MKGLAWTHNGIEDIAAAEIGKSAKDVLVRPPFIQFSVKNDVALAKICYMARSLRGVIELLAECPLSSLEAAAGSIDFSFIAGRGFAVRAKRFDEEIDAREIETTVGNFASKHGKVNLDSPDITVAVLVYEQKCCIGIDCAGFDLGKRDYKLFTSSASLKGSLAFAMLMVAGFKPGQTLLDPFARDGMVGIEAGLFCINKSVHFYSKDKLQFAKTIKAPFEDWDKPVPCKSKILMLDSLFHNVAAIKKNAKIAGVDKEISVSRQDIDWLDTKFEKESVDLIASYPPQKSERTDAKVIRKIYAELFHQAQYVLKQGGRMILVMRSMLPLENASWKPKNVLQVSQGKETLSFVLFEK